MVVSLVAKNGKTSNVTFGEVTPAQNNQYVRILGRPSVYLLSHYVAVEWQIAFEMAARMAPGAAKTAKTARASAFLVPVSLAWAVGYNSRELRQIRELVEERAAFFLEKWNEHFNPR